MSKRRITWIQYCKKTEHLTQGKIKISPDTLYGSLSKMEKDGLIKFIREEEKRKIYCITELGTQVLNLEMKRVFRQRMTPLLCIFFLIIIPQIIMQSHFNRPENYILAIIFCIMFCLYLGLFVVFGLQFRKYYKSIHKQ